jgi:uncharacterized protein (TIGR00251 family)
MAIRGKQSSGNREDLILRIRVEPRSSRPGIAGPYGEGLKVKLKSPPVEGRANSELIDLLSKEYGVPKQDIEIISGRNSKNKVVRLKGAGDKK